MCEPKWSWPSAPARRAALLPELRGAAGHRQDHPVDRVRPGLPAPSRNGDRGIMRLQDKIATSVTDRSREILSMATEVFDSLRERLEAAGRRRRSRTGCSSSRCRRKRCSTHLAAQVGIRFRPVPGRHGVDWPERESRFDVVYQFYSTRHFVRFASTRVTEADPRVDSLVRCTARPVTWSGSATHVWHRLPRQCRPAPICCTEGFTATRCARNYPKNASSRSWPTVSDEPALRPCFQIRSGLPLTAVSAA